MNTFKFIITKVGDSSYRIEREIYTETLQAAQNLLRDIYPEDNGYQYTLIEK